MVYFKENYHFSRFQRGSNIFQGGGGGPTFPGGSNCLFPIETHIACEFQGVGPLWIRTCYLSRCMRFPTMWYFDISRLGQALSLETTNGFQSVA